MSKNDIEKKREYFFREEAIDAFEQYLRRSLRQVPASLKPHFDHLANAMGKNLRAKSLLICAEDERNQIHSDAIRLAVAIELFHLATLVHDDILDHSDLRRGQQTLHKKFGNHQAVLCGDYLFAKAMEISAQLSIDRNARNYVIPFYARIICIGEVRQAMNSFNLNLSIYRYLSIIRGKTAVLFEAAFAGGAWILQDEHNFDCYRRVGRYIGMIFQMRDDLMDLESSQEIIKKPVFSDLKTGVITLPLIFAMKKNPLIKEQLLLCREGKMDYDIMRNMISAAGGMIQTRTMIDRYIKLAEREIFRLDISERKRSDILSVLNKAAGK